MAQPRRVPGEVGHTRGVPGTAGARKRNPPRVIQPLTLYGILGAIQRAIQRTMRGSYNDLSSGLRWGCNPPHHMGRSIALDMARNMGRFTGPDAESPCRGNGAWRSTWITPTSLKNSKWVAPVCPHAAARRCGHGRRRFPAAWRRDTAMPRSPVLFPGPGIRSHPAGCGAGAGLTWAGSTTPPRAHASHPVLPEAQTSRPPGHRILPLRPSPTPTARSPPTFFLIYA